MIVADIPARMADVFPLSVAQLKFITESIEASSPRTTLMLAYEGAGIVRADWVDTMLTHHQLLVDRAGNVTRHAVVPSTRHERDSLTHELV